MYLFFFSRSYPPPTIHSLTNKQTKTGTSTKQFHVEHRKKLESRKYKDEPEIVNYEEVVSNSQTHQNRKVKCECYSGTMFARLRAHWHVQEKQYLASMANLHGGQEGEGKSKMLFFKSKDERYVIKTVKEYELEEFLHLAESYCFHMLMNKDSLLCRFFGLYRIRARGFGNKIVIVMNNAFYSPLGKPLRVYDLKGSTHKREISEEDFKKGGVRQNVLLFFFFYI